MKFVLATLGVVLLLIIGGVFWLVATLFDSAPNLPTVAQLSANDLAGVRSFLRQVDPRSKVAGSLTQLNLREQDLNQSFNYLLNQRGLGRGNVAIEQGVLTVQLNLPVPTSATELWLNASVALVQQDNMLQVQQLKLGGFELSAVAAATVVAAMHSEFQQRSADYAALAGAVEQLTLAEDSLQVAYRWQPQLFEQLSSSGRELLLPPAQIERLQAHALQLAQLSRSPQLPARVPMTAMLAPMLQIAASRSGDAVEENRAALQVMAMYVMNVDQRLLLGQDPAGRPQRHEMQLAGQADYAQHFLISAALAVTTDPALTEQMGLLKEVQDLRAGGSGFSFPDLAVDRAGARFGAMAVQDTESAQMLQRWFASDTVTEASFIPDLSGLPAFMAQAEFEQRFEAVGSAAYNAVVADIESRIIALPLFAAE